MAKFSLYVDDLVLFIVHVKLSFLEQLQLSIENISHRSNYHFYFFLLTKTLAEQFRKESEIPTTFLSWI